MRRLKAIKVGGVAVVLGGIVTWLYFAIPEYRQVQNAVAVQNAQQCVRSSLATGDDFATCANLTDIYGRKIHFVALEEGYLFVSFGRDGVADREYEGKGNLQRASTCANWNLDTVWTLEEAVHVCLK